VTRGRRQRVWSVRGPLRADSVVLPEGCEVRVSEDSKGLWCHRWGCGVRGVRIGVRREREHGRADWVPRQRLRVEVRQARRLRRERRGRARGLERRSARGQGTGCKRNEIGNRGRRSDSFGGSPRNRDDKEFMTHIVAPADRAHPIEVTPLKLDAPEREDERETPLLQGRGVSTQKDE
jgi:hypothetical protein